MKSLVAEKEEYLVESSSPYKTPESAVIEKAQKKESLAPTFATLNFWRKFYLVLMWSMVAILVGTLALLEILAIMEVGVEKDTSPIFSLVLIFIIVLSSWWHHYAIVNRSADQLLVLALLNLFPLGNVINCLILFSIRRVTNKELQRYDISP